MSILPSSSIDANSPLLDDGQRPLRARYSTTTTGEPPLLRGITLRMWLVGEWRDSPRGKICDRWRDRDHDLFLCSSVEMVQGKPKGMQAKSPGAAARHASKAAAGKKKGLRDIPPKKTVLVKQAQLHKVGWITRFMEYRLLTERQSLTAKINRSIEQQMVTAASSGKLTIMKHSGPRA